VRRIFTGFLFALVAAIGFSLLSSLAICCGAAPATRPVSDAVAPLLGIFVGAWIASRGGSGRTGAYVGLAYVVLWLAFWMYLMGRLNPLLWIEEGLTHLTLSHLLWWALAVAAGALGGWARRVRTPIFLGIITALGVGLILVMALTGNGNIPAQSEAGYDIEHVGPTPDGTDSYLLTFNFQKTNHFTIGLYDCDSDDAQPYDDANTSYLGQSLKELVEKLDYQAGTHRQIVCAINGGFFGASGFSIAHHEEPIVQDGRTLYNVDLLRPKDQGWLFATRSPDDVLPGQSRFVMAPSLPWSTLGNYQVVLGGVRPLRVKGKSLPLLPGAGSTLLRCSRTSVGWSADGSKFYVLVVHDPDGEASSQVQRRMHGPQTGGWDVNEVQKFWEQRAVPFALLFDGGESSQLAFRDANDGFHQVPSGYQYSFTLGHPGQRPLLFTPPILPPSEAHRGVLNYLYVTGEKTSH
jgi:hypothetical protein